MLNQKRKYYYLPLFGLFLLLTSCGFLNEIKSIKSKFEVEAPQSFQTTTLKYELIDDHIVAPIMVNGKKLNFVFDTGAFTLFDSTISNVLKMNPKVGEKWGGNETTSGIDLRNVYFKDVKLEIGSNVFRKKEVLELGLDTDFKNCYNSFGLVGSDILSTSVTFLSPEKKELTFYSHEDFVKKDALNNKSYKIPISLKKIQKKPFVMVGFGNKNYKALWDWGGSVDLLVRYNSKLHQAQLSELIKELGSVIIDTFLSNTSAIANAQGKSLSQGLIIETYLVKLNSINLGGNKINAPANLLLVNWQNDKFDIIVGYGVIKQFESYLDFNKKYLYLNKINAPLAKRKEAPSFRLNEKTGEVTMILKGSILFRNGLSLSDKILKLDSQDFSSFTKKGDDCNSSKVLAKSIKESKNAIVLKANGNQVSIRLK